MCGRYDLSGVVGLAKFPINGRKQSGDRKGYKTNSARRRHFRILSVATSREDNGLVKNRYSAGKQRLQVQQGNVAVTAKARLGRSQNRLRENLFLDSMGLLDD
jgi:hypothetical protein